MYIYKGHIYIYKNMYIWDVWYIYIYIWYIVDGVYAIMAPCACTSTAESSHAARPETLSPKAPEEAPVSNYLNLQNGQNLDPMLPILSIFPKLSHYLALWEVQVGPKKLSRVVLQLDHRLCSRKAGSIACPTDYVLGRSRDLVTTHS